MTDQELERRLEQALSRCAPDDLEGVLSRCQARADHVVPIAAYRRPKRIRNWIAACLALVLVGGGGGMFYQQAYAVTSVVSLDVNPSIELKVNRQEKVLSCAALNEEAAAILSEMGGGADLKGTKLDVAVNAIVGALVRHGYLSSISSAILISVEDNDQNRAAKLQQELTATVDAVLQDQSAGASVLSQTLPQDASLEELAKEYNISTGKASLVKQAISLNSSLDFEALAQLSVEELTDLVETGAPGMPIGLSAAQQAAEEYAGVWGKESVSAEVDPELDERIAHYEVELYHPTLGEFEYMVDAYTGEILIGQANILQSSLTESGGGNTSSSGNSSSGNPSSPSTSGSTQIGSAGDIGSDKAKAAAFQHAGVSASEVTQLKLERDEDDGRIEYEIEFWVGGTEYDCVVDAASGSILKMEREDHGIPEQTGDIGSEEAKTVALNHAGVSESETTKMKVELDEDDGRLQYEVEFKAGGMEYEYTIDASSGAVLEHESDWDD
ncbi:PepSY domain-containing protein [Flavonifractor sp. An100]|uniref:PepSY domain-containing protein n=1 Tax=Flavonifractor sp. An100 TaxID=1965538 RepID=UPI000B3AA671|nr:PepSY domain-containing protein [Flavonifractor sp. An100]OUQ81642.1 hypothetical protein B5E43_01805 [Flavonifractor sp. An100]